MLCQQSGRWNDNLSERVRSTCCGGGDYRPYAMQPMIIPGKMFGLRCNNPAKVSKISQKISKKMPEHRSVAEDCYYADNTENMNCRKENCNNRGRMSGKRASPKIANAAVQKPRELRLSSHCPLGNPHYQLQASRRQTMKPITRMRV